MRFRTVTTFILASIFSIGVVGCGGGKDDSDPPMSNEDIDDLSLPDIDTGGDDTDGGNTDGGNGDSE
jgi:hypothetical protein